MSREHRQRTRGALPASVPLAPPMLTGRRRAVCGADRLMLEQAHERNLKERQELRKEVQAKLDASASRNRAKKARIAQLDKELHERSQVEEEKNVRRRPRFSCDRAGLSASSRCLRGWLLSSHRPDRMRTAQAYKEQCAALMEQCSSLMEQLRAAHGGGEVALPSPPRSSKLTSPPQHGGSFMDRVRSGIRREFDAHRSAGPDA